MRLIETPLPGAWRIELERLEDERGFFARTFCAEELGALGLDVRVAQCSLAYNRWRHTLRGMHWQADPWGETKLIRCTLGLVWDVLLDLRPGSPAYLRWYAAELSAENRVQLFVPPGVAHGYLTLSQESELSYQISTPYHPEAARGVRWDDPAFAIEWPFPPAVISGRDRGYPDFAP